MDWSDYVVFGGVILGSMGIGTYYGYQSRRQSSSTSTREYLQASRQMSYFPVSISIICSAVSAVSFIGNPTEIYLYGSQLLINIFAFIPLTLSLAYLYIPVYFNTNVNSAYEYIELRFNSGARLVVSLLALVDLVVGLAVTIYAPALAIEQITGIHRLYTSSFLYIVCVFYSTLGGLKGVLWTDVFQAAIMLASLLAIFIKGIVDVGGWQVMWQRNLDGHRIEFDRFDIDPRVRHTVWSSIIGGYFFSMPFYSTSQMQVQRYLSVPSLNAARKALIVNLLGIILIVGLTLATGLVIFAAYYDCDPLTSNAIEKGDQLLPYFATKVSSGIPGLLGLFIAGLTSASLSSLSSGLTALASITTYDYVNKIFPNISDSKLSLISKLNTVIFGSISFCFIFAIENMGNILQMLSSFVAILSGPTFGLFTLGMFFPWTNSKGVTMGLVVTFPLMILYVVGNLIYSRDMLDQRLPLSTEGCPNNAANLLAQYFEAQLTTESTPNEKRPQNALIDLLSVSYMWIPSLGCILMVFLGNIFSLFVVIFQPKTIQPVNSSCISKPILVIWQKIFSKKLIDSWICFDGVNEKTSFKSKLANVNEYGISA